MVSETQKCRECEEDGVRVGEGIVSSAGGGVRGAGKLMHEQSLEEETLLWIDSPSRFHWLLTDDDMLCIKTSLQLLL